MRATVGKLGQIKNKATAETKEEGTLYIDSYGKWYAAPKIDASKITKYLENVYLKGALDKIQRILFGERLIIEAYNQDSEPDPDLSAKLQTMVELPDVRLWYNIQRVWRDTAEWGPGLLNPVWGYDGSEYRLQKLRRLPPESFATAGNTSSNIRNELLPGIVLNTSTEEIEFYQKQGYGNSTKLENVFLVTDPLSGKIGGVPLILPIIPVISMLDFAWQARMSMVNRTGAGGLFTIKVTNPRGDDKAYAQRIIKNISKNTAFQLRENMEFINLGTAETSSAADTIDALSNLILDHFSPSSSISKSGTLISGSSTAEWEMYQAYIKGTHAWITEAFEQLLQPYLRVNAYSDYTIQITIPAPTLDRSEFLLKALDSAQANRRVTTIEARKIYTDLGLPLPELSDEELAALDGQQSEEQMLQKAKLVVDAISANEMDPEHLISEDDAKAILNKALRNNGN